MESLDVSSNFNYLVKTCQSRLESIKNRGIRKESSFCIHLLRMYLLLVSPLP